MLLYHGSNVEVNAPRVDCGRAKVDFGPGFYLTTLADQAEKWARQRAGENQVRGIVSVFDFEDSDQLFHKSFDGYSEDWLMFVVENRRSDFPVVRYGYDVISGNIADDKVVRVINDFIERLQQGRVDEVQIAATLRDLTYQDANDQYCFATEKALRFLKFQRSYEV
ncbi:MAG: DUF3990 domain-containing protein [Coriobacteriales bacterium]|jgi:hypothetical protein|nr:DUF3990 domain-containing protein [Coriobacteriales bacterium]